MHNKQSFTITSSMKMGTVSGAIGGMQAGMIMGLFMPIALSVVAYVGTIDFGSLTSFSFEYDYTVWLIVLMIALWWLIITILSGLIGLLGGAIGGPLLILYFTKKHWPILATFLGAVSAFTLILLIVLLDSPRNTIEFSGEVIAVVFYAIITGALGGYLGGRRLRSRIN